MRVASGKLGGWGGLIWGQSIDLPSLYLLSARRAKINEKANSSPPPCGLVNTPTNQAVNESDSAAINLLIRKTHVEHTKTRAHSDTKTTVSPRCNQHTRTHTHTHVHTHTHADTHTHTHAKNTHRHTQEGLFKSHRNTNYLTNTQRKTYIFHKS